jgi:hypothetical protein
VNVVPLCYKIIKERKIDTFARRRKRKKKRVKYTYRFAKNSKNNNNRKPFVVLYKLLVASVYFQLSANKSLTRKSNITPTSNNP